RERSVIRRTNAAGHRGRTRRTRGLGAAARDLELGDRVRHLLLGLARTGEPVAGEAGLPLDARELLFLLLLEGAQALRLQLLVRLAVLEVRLQRDEPVALERDLVTKRLH